MLRQFYEIISSQKGKTGFVTGLDPSHKNNLQELLMLSANKQSYQVISCADVVKVIPALNFDYCMLAQKAPDESPYNIKNIAGQVNSRPGTMFLYADCLDLTPPKHVSQLLTGIDHIGFDDRHFTGLACSDGASADGRNQCCERLDSSRQCIQEVLQHMTGMNTHYGTTELVEVHMLALAVILGLNPIYVTGIDLKSMGYISRGIIDPLQIILNDIGIIVQSAKNIGVNIYCMDEELIISQVLPYKKFNLPSGSAIIINPAKLTDNAASVPSMIPHIDKNEIWINCLERLPEKNDFYEIKGFSNNGNFVEHDLWFGGGIWGNRDGTDVFLVLAWKEKNKKIPAKCAECQIQFTVVVSSGKVECPQCGVLISIAPAERPVTDTLASIRTSMQDVYDELTGPQKQFVKDKFPELIPVSEKAEKEPDNLVPHILVFTEIIGCAEVGKVAIETFHKYHNSLLYICIGSDEDKEQLGEIAKHHNNVWVDYKNTKAIEKFKNGHEGTAEVFANMMLNPVCPDYIIHFDSDVVFKKESLSLITDKFNEGYDIVGSRRCYVNNPGGIAVKANTPDSVSTYFYGMKRSVVPKVTFNQLCDMFTGRFKNGVEWEVFDFGDAVTFSALAHGAQIFFIDPFLIGGQNEKGKKYNGIKANLHVDAGEHLLHFGGAGSGCVCFNEPEGKNENYGRWAVVRYSLFCEIFNEKTIPVDAGNIKFDNDGRWVSGNFNAQILNEIIKALEVKK